MFALVLNAISVRQLLITSKHQVVLIKSSVNSVHNVGLIKLSIFVVVFGQSGIMRTLSPWQARKREPITGVWWLGQGRAKLP